ncbi:MAG: HD domain-containing protein [Nocardioides sp.]
METGGRATAALLDVLEPDRRAHSVAVGLKVAMQVHRLEPDVRDTAVTAALLHDIGYGYPTTGFHPLDGARFLAAQGFPVEVCHLVIHHSASTYEARERGIDLGVYREFAVERDLDAAHRVLWWADMTTGPTGLTVRVDDRLDEIVRRYGPGHVVSAFIEKARPLLSRVCQSPEGSIHVSV